ncbi:2Fe-2S iron-sulfur cluster binding domain-containing protein [Gordonia amarae]|uniref:2Fe-2S iron-sulfur cluster binding domain-containing protein n=2 Tax=Gordonia amarae TaxID=36821 RepID=A0A857M8B2_9ACTN|nr:PDR/VanB family oxidoreductase [Gordonia amarae]MCS3876982.1 ferredoxin-NADP reductase [Gordonia amarae]QHN15803.1 2Fe-2S iron-sulfur cluster binding domain-containing protein [Gordonia amarae]QHN20371.1 2Fe-2S iron-sulfur cluster binding domain-containing protein [Gordonia amarae]QHN29223.1 2Fe-2S iron-sulfur cluster binding domain-containing protein [Gordonia amarae]QHN38002.1 2Fe-2S iron-sulfur cluster binding domain-containing protein [Gordonia amarae]
MSWAGGAATLVVRDITDQSGDIRSFTFAAPDGAPLPAFVAGSHLVVRAGERTNAYSLTSDGTAPTEYSISVLRVAGGNGGSRWLHDELSVGDSVEVIMPRSAFAPLAAARKHLLIAGGIGITPMISHLRAARRWGRTSQVLYVHREVSPAHLDDLAALSDGADCEIETFTSRDAFISRLATALRGQPVGTHLYVCGPSAMIDGVVEAAEVGGWPRSRIHAELFGTDALDPGEPFEVRLGSDGRILSVSSGVSMLEALETGGIEVRNLCRQGVCGECRIPVTSGTPLHRDHYLSDEEKHAGDVIMPCVSRAAAGCTLEVPL